MAAAERSKAETGDDADAGGLLIVLEQVPNSIAAPAPQAPKTRMIAATPRMLPQSTWNMQQRGER